jgi:hypothetical protein
MKSPISAKSLGVAVLGAVALSGAAAAAASATTLPALPGVPGAGPVLGAVQALPVGQVAKELPRNAHVAPGTTNLTDAAGQLLGGLPTNGSPVGL